MSMKLTGIERLQQNRSPKKVKKIDKIVKGVCIYWILFVITA